jgi:hypothetical protein
MTFMRQLIRYTGIALTVIALLYAMYARYYMSVAGVVLVGSLFYFGNRFECRQHRLMADSSPSPTGPTRTVVRYLLKGFGCFLIAAIIGLGIGMKISNVQLGLAFALTGILIGVIGFVGYLMRALGF